MNQYLLMNKDMSLLLFSCERDEFDEPVFTEIKWYSDKKPLGFIDMFSFISQRQAPKHRAHIQEILNKFNCNDLEGFIRVTFAVSLNDTFWVKEYGSNIKWNDISLYRNDFNELISRAAFDGYLGENILSSTSPEFTTDGGYSKCWVRDDNGIWLYKTGSDLYGIEPFSEFLATQVSSKICNNPVEYDLSYHHNKLISKCELFTSEKYGYAPASRFFSSIPSVKKLLKFYDEIGSGEEFRRMCVLDALIFNHDRHFGNFGVIFDNDTIEIKGMAPIFDNNRSLFYNIDDSFSNFEYVVRNTKPRFGTDFNVTASGLLTSQIASDLKNLSGFEFVQHDISFPQHRLNILNRFVDCQINLLLNRIPVYFAVQNKQFSLGINNITSKETSAFKSLVSTAKNKSESKSSNHNEKDYSPTKSKDPEPTR